MAHAMTAADASTVLQVLAAEFSDVPDAGQAVRIWVPHPLPAERTESRDAP